MISDGTVLVGAQDHGNLIVPDAGPPSAGTGTTAVGLRDQATQGEGPAAGCHCEG